MIECFLSVVGVPLSSESGVNESTKKQPSEVWQTGCTHRGADGCNDGYAVDCIVELDVGEARCPLPALKTKQALSQLKKGECLNVFFRDRGSVRELMKLDVDVVELNTLQTPFSALLRPRRVSVSLIAKP